MAPPVGRNWWLYDPDVAASDGRCASLPVGRQSRHSHRTGRLGSRKEKVKIVYMCMCILRSQYTYNRIIVTTIMSVLMFEFNFVPTRRIDNSQYV